MADKDLTENTLEETEQSKPDKKSRKEKKKEKKEKKEKKKKNSGKEEGNDSEEETLGSKVMLVFVTLLIILIWLAIFAVLIKADVGGFGSSVLYPVLKDVPYINKILPDTDDSLLPEDTQYQYDSLDDAIERIKELELELGDANSISAADAQTIADLQAQIEDLSKYKEEQAEFEKEKEKFYEEVVFSDEAPDIEEYKTFYESIDPENAEVLYKQVVEQITYDQEVIDYAQTYSSMKAKEAAAIFDTMTDNLDLVADILQNMDVQSRADILAQMDEETAAKLTQIMEPEK